MCVAWPRKAALIGSSCLPARLDCVETFSRLKQVGNGKHFGAAALPLPTQLPPSAEHATTVRHTDSVLCPGQQRLLVFVCVCVFWLTVNPKLMLLSFCSLLFVYVRLYVWVYVALVCVWMFVSHCRDRMAAFGALFGAICAFILSMIHAPHMKMCNILTLTRAHKHTHAR